MNMMQQMGVLFTLEIAVNPAAPPNTEGNVNENTSRFGKADKTLGLPVTVKQID